jgi:hypothetical protein
MTHSPDIGATAATPPGTLLRRVARVCALDKAVYTEVERDPHGTRQAAVVVTAVAAAAVLATILSDGWHAGAIVAALIHWLLWGVLVYVVATVLFRAPTRRAAVVRGLGYAQAPLLLGGLGFIPFLGPVIVLFSRVLGFLAGHRAMGATLRLRGWRLMATTLVSFLITFAVAGVVRAVLGDVHLFDGLARP